MESSRALSRRCAGFKNVSMWMDSILTWDESHSFVNDNRRFTKAFRAKPKSTVFADSKVASPIWSSESKESFKPYDITKLDYHSDGERAQIHKKLYELKAKYATFDKRNNANKPSSESGTTVSDSKKTEVDHDAPMSSNQGESQPSASPNANSVARPDLSASDHPAPGSPPETSQPIPVDNAATGPPRAQSALQLPNPAPKKKPPTQVHNGENQTRRQKARQQIKAKWEARRHAQTSSQLMSSTRQLSDTAVAFLLGRRPFATFADQTGSNGEKNLRLSFNINPELYPNQPRLVQTADSAVERAILKNGPQPIGCKQRIKMLQAKSVKNRLERRKESLARLSHSPDSGRWATPEPKQNPIRQIEGYFVKI